LVNKSNDKAKKLYTALGFEVKGEKELLGGFHYHLQYRVLNDPRQNLLP
jgi:ribosomal protein S18 acetylase RimI-like enzyme